MKTNKQYVDVFDFSGEEPESVGLVVNRSANRCILDSEMEYGRDEMNLVEFPLAGLASRMPKGKDSLVFEDWTWDKQQRTNIRKRLTVTASSEYGLPSALDDEVILGLVQLAKSSEFKDRNVSFIPAELFRLLGWREEGRSYSRLETSLKRWLGVTLYYDNAWWDKQRKTWCDEHFHLLDNVTIRRRPRKSTNAKAPQRQPWSITWNEIVFRSCQAGYLKRLDMSIYRQLSLAAAKRMFRFLDKRFYFMNRLTFDLRTFACEHIGFRRDDDNSQLKRRLNRAIDQLEGVGFLEPLTSEARYRKVCHGRWEVVFIRKQATVAKQQAKDTNPIQAMLVKRGIRKSVATQLVRDHSESTIREAIDKFDQLMQLERSSLLDNPPGLLVAWIRESGKSPSIDSKDNQSASKRVIPEPVQKRHAEEEARSKSEREVVTNYLKQLTQQEREALEIEAISQAKPFHAKCYRRADSTGNTKLLHQYREMMIAAHVGRLLRCEH